MTINVGETVPAVELKRLDGDDLSTINTGEYFKGRKVVLFSLPGAFTPTCSAEHLPGYIARAHEIKSKGIDEIVCLAVNDHWVMKAWLDQQGAQGKVVMFADGNAEFSRALGIVIDLSIAGLGARGLRCSMIIDDGVVKTFDAEPGRGVSVSGADACLTNL